MFANTHSTAVASAHANVFRTRFSDLARTITDTHRYCIADRFTTTDNNTDSHALADSDR
jgi:hypothetical protein